MGLALGAVPLQVFAAGTPRLTITFGEREIVVTIPTFPETPIVDIRMQVTKGGQTRNVKFTLSSSNFQAFASSVSETGKARGKFGNKRVRVEAKPLGAGSYTGTIRVGDREGEVEAENFGQIVAIVVMVAIVGAVATAAVVSENGGSAKGTVETEDVTVSGKVSSE